MKDNAWVQDCQRCPAHSPLPVGTKQIQTCTKLLHLLCKICHPWAEWCHLKVPLWGQTAATADEVPAHDSMDHTIALLPKYPLPRGSMARKAAGNRQPSACPTHPQRDVGPAYFPMGVEPSQWLPPICSLGSQQRPCNYLTPLRQRFSNWGHWERTRQNRLC